MPTPADLNRAVANMARHLTPGGLLAVEAWLDPAIVRPDHLSASFVDEPDLKIARMSVTRLIDGRITQFDMHHLVATQQGVEHFVERHELTLFTDAEYCTAFAAAGLDMVRDDDGIFGRWLYLGVQGGDHE
jgi:translation initiation factor 2 gamma subunit (eIF-2gamma)